MSEGCIVQSPITIDAVSAPSLVEAQSNAVAVDVEQSSLVVDVIGSPISVEVETTPIVVEVLQNALITVPAIAGYRNFNIETNGQAIFDLPEWSKADLWGGLRDKRLSVELLGCVPKSTDRLFRNLLVGGYHVFVAS